MIVSGYAFAGPHKARAAYDQTVEGSVYVKDDQRVNGIGTHLLVQLIEAAARHGYRPARSSASRPHFGYRRNCQHMPLA